MNVPGSASGYGGHVCADHCTGGGRRVAGALQRVVMLALIAYLFLIKILNFFKIENQFDLKINF